MLPNVQEDWNKLINWLKERNLWHIEEPVWQPGYKKVHPGAESKIGYPCPVSP